MDGLFVELPAFARVREEYLDDDAFSDLQHMLLANPFAGPVIKGTGGVRKVRFADGRRGKGKRGGLRVIYYYWVDDREFLLFTVYDKDEADDMTNDERSAIYKALKLEIEARQKERK